MRLELIQTTDGYLVISYSLNGLPLQWYFSDIQDAKNQMNYMIDLELYKEIR